MNKELKRNFNYLIENGFHQKLIDEFSEYVDNLDSQELLHYAYACFNVSQIDLALEALKKSEERGHLGKFPMASFKRGILLRDTAKSIEDALEAVQAFQKAEDDNPNSSYPNASFERGRILGRMGTGQIESAINAYLKAEKDSPKGRFSSAAYNRAVLLKKRGNINEAVQAFEKAESDGPYSKNPEASCGRGILLAENGSIEDAIAAFRKAEEDSPDNHFPGAFLHRVTLISQMYGPEEAIEECLSSESRLPGKRFPEATETRASLLWSLGRNDEALKAYSKAERDNDGVWPRASLNRGIILSQMNKRDEAILAFNKSISDTPNKIFPKAFYNRGVVYYIKGQYEKSYEDFENAILHSEEPYLVAYFYKSKSLLKIGRYLPAKQACFQAYSLSQFRDIRFTGLIEQHFSGEYSNKFYRNRIRYCEIFLVEQALDTNPAKLEWSHETLLPNPSDNKLLMEERFCLLLMLKELNLDLNLNISNRYRLAYLIHFRAGRPWQTFHIIDEFLEEETELSPMDYYFYLLSAYHIAEPYSELQSIFNRALEPQNPFTSQFEKLADKMKTAHEEGQYHDPYFLKLKAEDIKPKISGLINFGGPELIEKVLLDIQNEKDDFGIPLTDIEISGLLSQYILQFEKQPDNKPFLKLTEWENFKDGLAKAELKPKQMIDNIRNAIKTGIPYLMLMNTLYEKHINDDTDGTQRKQIASLQATVLLSNYLDHLNKSGHPNTNLEIASTCVAESLTLHAIQGIIEVGLISGLGISGAVAVVGKVLFTTYEKYEAYKADRIFQEILNEIESTKE